MAGLRNSSGKYLIHVTGGRPKLSVGDRARMNLVSRQRRGFSTSSSARATSKITGPEQKLKYIPPSALSEVVMYLNNYSPLGNNWKAIADEMLITFEAIRSLDHHGPDGMMSGVLDIMFHRKVTVGLFVQMLQRIQRPDVIDILVKAGLQGDFFQEYESDEGGLKTDEFNSCNDLQAAAEKEDCNVYQTGKSGTSYNEDENDQGAAELNFTLLTCDTPELREIMRDNVSQRTIEARNYGAAHEELVRARASSSAETATDRVPASGRQSGENNVASGIERICGVC